MHEQNLELLKEYNDNVLSENVNNIDNGDVQNVQVGDELTVITPETNQVASVIYVVHKIDDIGGLKRILLSKNGRQGGGYLAKNNGKLPSMYEKNPRYYSANPKHIAIAKKQIKRNQDAEKVQEEQDKQKAEEFKNELDQLLQKYGASIGISFGAGSDTHGIYDEKILAYIGKSSIRIDAD